MYHADPRAKNIIAETNTAKKLIFDNYSKTELPKNKNDLAFYSVGQLAELIRTRKITSTELTKFYLDRLKKYGPKLECVITLTEDLAL